LSVFCQKPIDNFFATLQNYDIMASFEMCEGVNERSVKGDSYSRQKHFITQSHFTHSLLTLHSIIPEKLTKFALPETAPLMEKNWTLKTLPPQPKIDSLAKALNINPALATLLVQRGVETFDEAKSFFRPSLASLHDPFLMKNMDKAVKRLADALEKEEKIVIYGDYDVDGTTSVALVYSFLKSFYPYVQFYIPDRHKEGYGVSLEGIEWAKQNGICLIISLDCGIKSEKPVELANAYGIDFIICDHHLPDEHLPLAHAVLDAKQPGCEYPYKELSGCGVGFKLMQALCLHLNISLEKLFAYLDLVAVSIAADMVAITGENRIMTYHGIKKLNENPRPGLKALKEIAGLGKEMNVSNIVFGFAPRINASGRLEHADASVNLLLSGDETEARTFAQTLNKTNTNRQNFDKSITEQALAMIEAHPDCLTAKTTVLFHPDWHKGVIGIVASRCIEKYYRPTIILTGSNGKVTGSARSVKGFDVHQAICECADLLDQFGGHQFAAGVTMKLENVERFRQRFEEVVASQITEEQLIPCVEADYRLDFNHITPKLLRIIRQMAPFGPHNLEPLFVTENVICAGQPQILKEIHLKMHVQQFNSTIIETIAFGMANHFPLVSSGKPFRLCYHIGENTYNGRTSLQLMVKDMKGME
jgi:single-stranded-DNA-specific exonuclease